MNALSVLRTKNCPYCRIVDVLAFWRGKLGSMHEPVKLPQVTIDSPPVQPCTVCLGASYSDRLRQLVTSNR